MIADINTVLYTCMFLLPGGIIEATTRSIKPRRRISAAQELLRWLGYSVVNNAIWSWAILIIWKQLPHDSLLTWILLLAVIITSSVITGIILGFIQTKDIISKTADLVNIRIENPIPTAWDYVLSRQRNPCFMIVTLIDGTHFYGYFGEDSLASSDNDYRDIYLEYIYVLNDTNEKWEIVPGKSALLNADQIASIEIIRLEEING